MSAGFTNFGIGACAILFGALAVRLRPGAVSAGVPRMRLRIAALLMVAWALVSGLAAHGGGRDPGAEILLSLAVISLWLWQLDAFARWQGQPRSIRHALQGAGVFAPVFTLGWMLIAARTDLVGPP